MIPTSIDGTDITGATIDGQDVQEITVDGDTVFTAGPQINNLPVAYSNLVAWYPFDSATYGGSNADDVTAILGGSGDDTAYDGTLDNSPNYQSSGGVTDINTGANSGRFDFDNNASIGITGLSNQSFSQITVSLWVNIDANTGEFNAPFDVFGGSVFHQGTIEGNGASSFEMMVKNASFASNSVSITTISTGNWVHLAYSYDNSTLRTYADGSLQNSINDSGHTFLGNTIPGIGGRYQNSATFFDGKIDDVRIYNTALSSSQISQIYQNTVP